MDENAFAQPHSRHQGHARDQFTIRTDFAIVADHATGADNRAGFDPATRTDEYMWADASGGIDRSGNVDDGARMDASSAHGFAFEQGSDLRERRVRIAGDQCRVAAGLEIVRAQYDNPGGSLRKLAAVTRVGKEAQLLRRGTRQGADAVYLAIIAMQFKFEP